MYLAGGEIKRSNENYACVYSDDLKPKIKALNLESKELTGYREVFVCGAVEVEKVLAILMQEKPSFNKIEVNTPV